MAAIGKFFPGSDVCGKKTATSAIAMGCPMSSGRLLALAGECAGASMLEIPMLFWQGCFAWFMARSASQNQKIRNNP